MLCELTYDLSKTVYIPGISTLHAFKPMTSDIAPDYATKETPRENCCLSWKSRVYVHGPSIKNALSF